MEFRDYFPVWDELEPAHREKLAGGAIRREVKKGTILHHGGADCTGLLLVVQGQLRACILSDQGREITLYRLLERDICLFSAPCMMNSIRFDITIEAEKDTQFWLIPSELYKEVMDGSAPAANFTNRIMASRFSEVMWLMEQILWKSFDKRLAGFLLEERMLEGSGVLKLTHENIANHLGTAREVVTRMLQYFQSEGLVALRRGSVELTDETGLAAMRDR